MDIYEFLIPDEAITAAVSNACEFFGLPEVPIVNSEGVCVWSNDVHTTFDDVIGVNREQLSDMGMISDDSLKMAYTHECAHRALQGYDVYEGPREELVCDYFAGIHAELNDINSDQFEAALGQTTSGETHPDGALRVDAVEYGKQIAAEMKAQGITPTFEYCLDRFEDFRGEHVDSSTPVSLFVNMIHNGHDNISFGNKYDESTGEFVEMMKQYGLDIPVGVDHTPGNEVVTMDRSYYGGMTQIDKSICNDKIEQAYNEGKITEEGRDKLREKLYSC